MEKIWSTTFQFKEAGHGRGRGRGDEEGGK
jgi:hypothetical protein